MAHRLVDERPNNRLDLAHGFSGENEAAIATIEFGLSSEAKRLNPLSNELLLLRCMAATDFPAESHPASVIQP